MEKTMTTNLSVELIFEYYGRISFGRDILKAKADLMEEENVELKKTVTQQAAELNRLKRGDTK